MHLLLKDYLELTGAVIGLLYLWLELRASIWLWPVGIVMPALYVYIFYVSGFYADMGINVYYFGAGIYGWAMWLRGVRAERKEQRAVRRARQARRTCGWLRPLLGKRSSRPGLRPVRSWPAALLLRASAVRASSTALGLASVRKRSPTVSPTGPQSDQQALTVPISSPAEPNSTPPAPLLISRTPRRHWLPMAGVFTIFFVILVVILKVFTDSTVPIGDGFTTALSIVALWMLSRKYVEQWLIWIVVDGVCAGLFIYKGLYPTFALYAFYTVAAVFGYFKWVKSIGNESA